MSREQYDYLLLDLYIGWCTLQYPSPCKLLCQIGACLHGFGGNTTIETSLCPAGSHATRLSTTSKRKLYDDLTTTIFTYPKPLLEEIRRKANRNMRNDLT